MLTSILVFLLVLSVLVLVHELGHFIVARRNGVLVEEFGFGIPPRLIGKKIGRTLYSLNWLPFGGFVKLHGESSEEKLTFPKQAFLNKGKRVRIAILTAGVIMNFLLGIVVFAVIYSFTGVPKETTNIRIVDIAVSSPAQESKLVVGDIVRKVDKDEIKTVKAFVEAVEKKKGQRVTLEIERKVGENWENKKITLTPRVNPPENEGPMGVTISTSEVYFPPVYLRPFYGVYYGTKEAVFWGKTVAVGFGQIFVDLLGGKAPKDLAGPIGIFAITSQAAKIGWLAVLNFVGILSINLAILNIIPFPALDGGRLFFVLIESVIGKKILPKVEAVVHAVGMVILILLILAITAKDIQRLIAASSISGFLDSVLK